MEEVGEFKLKLGAKVGEEQEGLFVGRQEGASKAQILKLKRQFGGYYSKA